MTTFTRTTHNPLLGFFSPGTVGATVATARVWGARWIQRRRLAELTETELRDIGVTAGAATREAMKPFWRA